MEQVYKKDGTSLKIMTEEDMKAINLVPYINQADWYDVHNAYCSNGVVYITIMIRGGNDFHEKESQLLNDSRYYPYGSACGFVNIQSSVTNVDKILNAKISSSGSLYVWVSQAINYGELVTFIYPLKS